jgi:hypothetical protein
MGHIAANCPDKNQETGLMVGGFYVEKIKPSKVSIKEQGKVIAEPLSEWVKVVKKGK